jgi:hypothetical protein
MTSAARVRRGQHRPWCRTTAPSTGRCSARPRCRTHPQVSCTCASCATAERHAHLGAGRERPPEHLGGQRNSRQYAVSPRTRCRAGAPTDAGASASTASASTASSRRPRRRRSARPCWTSSGTGPARRARASSSRPRTTCSPSPASVALRLSSAEARITATRPRGRRHAAVGDRVGARARPAPSSRSSRAWWPADGLRAARRADPGMCASLGSFVKAHGSGGRNRPDRPEAGRPRPRSPRTDRSWSAASACAATRRRSRSRAVRADHPVAGHDHRDRVAVVGERPQPGGGRLAGSTAICPYVVVRPNGISRSAKAHLLLKRCRRGQRQLEPGPGTGE